jgi:hypothetical protein
MHVGADADARCTGAVRLTGATARRARARSRSPGVVILKLRSSPGTVHTGVPMLCTSAASSVCSADAAA